jgi:glutamate 5-kinase
MDYRSTLKHKKRIVIKIGTSTLSYPSGRLNFQIIEKMVKVLGELRQRGIQIVLVSSGSIGVGAGRLGLTSRPEELSKKQALAAIGQAELIKIYQKFFEDNNQIVAQVLLTKDIVTIPKRHKNAKNTLKKLLSMGIIPIINENDTIATNEIEFGDNDTLSAHVAELIGADLLIMLSDIDGLFSADPKTESSARIIYTVHGVTPRLEKIATNSGTSFSTGGMSAKIAAVKISSQANIDTVITNGSDPTVVFKILDGERIGTLFLAKRGKLTKNKSIKKEY